MYFSQLIHIYQIIDFYQNIEEDVPIDMPETRENKVGLRCFVDASYAANEVTRKSQTFIFIFMIKASIIFNSKNQNSV